MPTLFLLFVAVPIIEIAVLIKVGSSIGLFATLVIVILTAIIGTAMLRWQGMATLMSARARLRSGEMPAMELLEGVFLLIGGVLLLTPGFVTDAVGFACLFPPTRRILVRMISRRASFAGVDFTARTSSGTGPPQDASESAGTARQASRPRDANVLEGEYRRED